ncbi:threonine/homoserine/homoserine lactone efflux protein [Conyzicola lurida]|uniref:Threonine/homoserine/homoserine lactone efflux protein n=1 Tax=Conyzicola lurida TaxID=1172621 RepID=A0A841AKU6_9MICO|nr:LysE family translocator [Conyzicola lurida]MBB5842069.1 threonine/homoserine/homoserine lactone efflux protein [Conyzicola lurida]
MTVTAALLSFAVVAALLTITPGLDTALVLRSALVQGHRLAIATGIGIISGAFVWGVAASAGLAALLRASEVAFTVLRIVGAAYMIWLGARLIYTRVIKRTDAAALASADGALPRGWWGAWSKGLLTNLLNPKVGAFYVAVLPGFIPAGANELVMGVLLAAVHGVETAAWFTLIIFGARGVRRWLERDTVRKWIDGVTGAALVGFGVRLAIVAK